MKQTSCLLRYHGPLPQVLSLAPSDFLFENAVKVIDADSWWLVGTLRFFAKIIGQGGMVSPGLKQFGSLQLV